MSHVYKNLRIPFSETEIWNTAAYIECIIGRYSYSYSSTSTRTCTHVIIKCLYSYSDSDMLQVLVFVLVNPVLTPALLNHYNDAIMGAIVSQITSLTIVFSTVYSEQIKENIKAPRHWPLCGEFTGISEFPAQRASNGENVSIWWRHHVIIYPSLPGQCRSARCPWKRPSRLTCPQWWVVATRWPTRGRWWRRRRHRRAR